MKRSVLCVLAAMTFAACSNKDASMVNLATGYDCNELFAPWDSLSNTTSFKCSCDKEFFNFEFVAQDSTIMVEENYISERCVEYEDRVELFFSPDSLMTCYHCMEIDALGRIMDYEAKYYRLMDYEWNFTTLEASGEIIEGGYRVSGRLTLEELRNLGIPTDGNVFWFGVFQGNFRQDGPENWFSRVKTADVVPDFHKPDVLFPVVIK